MTGDFSFEWIISALTSGLKRRFQNRRIWRSGKKTTNWNTNRVIVSLQHQAEAASIDIKGKDKNTSNRLWKPVATDLAFIKTHASSSAVWIYKQIITPHNVVQSTATQQNINLLVLGCLIRRRFQVLYLSYAQQRQWRGSLQWSYML